MILYLNGEKRILDRENISIAEFLTNEGVNSLDTVTVQLNSEYLPKERFNQNLKDGDEVEFVYFMGGGR